ncbi:MAG TPA: rhomboid family intramembrane serine protease [Actinomycetota bacterium]|nr:rhomboid family intramembrane serine protease [Actinomycetota bacterium]
MAEARKTAPKVRSAARANAPAVVAIIVVNVVIFIAQLGSAGVTNRFAAFAPAIQNGEYYRLITAMFLHSPSFILHILFNMYILYAYGQNVEQAFGTLRFIVMYLVAGFMGSVASYAFGSCNAASVGASGAIFGVVGILVIYAYNRRTSAIMSQYLRGIMIFIGINMVISFGLPNIDYLAHIGGLLAGMALGLGFDRGLVSGRARSVALQAAFVVAMVGVGVALLVWRTANFAQLCG